MDKPIDHIVAATIAAEVRALAEKLVGARLLTEQEWRDMVLDEQAIAAHEAEQVMKSDSLERQAEERF